MQIIQDNEN